MKNESAVCTLLKAEAVCVTPPSCMAPLKYAGLTRMKGKTIAACR
jgi:hypothetical protein